MLVRDLIKNYDKLGLWTSVFVLGAFVGPTLAGILFDAVGFPLATVFILVAELAALVALFIGLLRTLRFVYRALSDMIGCVYIKDEFHTKVKKSRCRRQR